MLANNNRRKSGIIIFAIILIAILLASCRIEQTHNDNPQPTATVEIEQETSTQEEVSEKGVVRFAITGKPLPYILVRNNSPNSTNEKSVFKIGEFLPFDQENIVIFELPNGKTAEGILLPETAYLNGDVQIVKNYLRNESDTPPFRINMSIINDRITATISDEETGEVYVLNTFDDQMAIFKSESATIIKRIALGFDKPDSEEINLLFSYAGPGNPENVPSNALFDNVVSAKRIGGLSKEGFSRVKFTLPDESEVTAIVGHNYETDFGHHWVGYGTSQDGTSYSIEWVFEHDDRLALRINGNKQLFQITHVEDDNYVVYNYRGINAPLESESSQS